MNTDSDSQIESLPNLEEQNEKNNKTVQRKATGKENEQNDLTTSTKTTTTIVETKDEEDKLKNALIKLQQENFILKERIVEYERQINDNGNNVEIHNNVERNNDNNGRPTSYVYGNTPMEDEVCDGIVVKRIKKKKRFEDYFQDFNHEDLNNEKDRDFTNGEIFNRNKREVDVGRHLDETYSINAKNDINIDDNKLSTVGSINGLKAGKSYEDISGGVDYKTTNGHSVSILGLHSKETGTKLSAHGTLNILDTPTQTLKAKGFVERELPTKFSDSRTKYGGSLDYDNKIGNNFHLSAQRDTYGDQIFGKGKVTLYKNDVHNLNAKGKFLRNLPFNPMLPATNTYSGSLNYDNKNGHSLSVAAQHLPNFGDQLSAKGKFNLFHNPNHNLNAEAKFTKTFPSTPGVGNFNVYSGNLDYLYKDKIGATLGLKHSNFNDQTDYSLMGKLNLFHDTNTDFDFNAGLTKSVSPFLSDGSLHPSFGFTFSKSF